MIHYTCDRCKRAIDPETELRYVVEIEIHAASCDDSHGHIRNEGGEDEVDHLAELHDQLQREVNPDIEPQCFADDDFGDLDDAESTDHCQQYDLCEQCHDAFLNNPLGREATVGLGFSNN
ncbi:hypothetical protein [Roseiconus lacunae]|uniref:Uncharacterized protein n=1 Tax=Roseiconus lacunae TaxID=2605694 RepID=A0ABT7PMU8_9BACT|nr:hypothetical protein [Roseiconus lacunae]MCD0460649.1 hypothetical protein [Roseiconus lacunae]MDM4017810.1 hypothetical protein [Roseiconus lacunae]WRQ48446.1 hypothetical protein U8335_15885 [Stieleria sp. HD01]